MEEVIGRYGGYEKFYHKFYMAFVCPFGIVKTTDKGSSTNANYYDNKEFKNVLKKIIVGTLKTYVTFNIDTSICFVIGSGANYRFLLEINNSYHLFDKIIPLEHPRFIMQYHSKNKDKYIEKYLSALEDRNILV